MVKWISLHAAARKGLPMLGRSLAKQKSNCVFYFWAFFWFDIWLVRAWVQETHTGECPRGVLVYVNGGHIWGITEFIQAPEQWSRAGVRCMDTTMHHHLLTSLLHSSSSLFIDFSLLLLFFSLNRYHNMGNLLKVLTCTDLEQEPNFFLDFESEFSF